MLSWHRKRKECLIWKQFLIQSTVILPLQSKLMRSALTWMSASGSSLSCCEGAPGLPGQHHGNLWETSQCFGGSSADEVGPWELQLDDSDVRGMCRPQRNYKALVQTCCEGQKFGQQREKKTPSSCSCLCRISSLTRDEGRIDELWVAHRFSIYMCILTHTSLNNNSTSRCSFHIAHGQPLHGSVISEDESLLLKK